MERAPWHDLSDRQAGMLAVRQLAAVGVTREAMRHRLRSERWVRRSEHVLSTTTGDLNDLQRAWLGVLHVGNGALVGGLSAARFHGLRNWDREDVTILVPDDWSFEAVPGLHFFRTRRPLDDLAGRARSTAGLPVCQLEPAVLLFAGYDRSARTAQGVVAASVQQGLTRPDRLRTWIVRLRPLRRSKLLQRALLDIEGGAQSLAEIDVRRMCRLTGLPAPDRQRQRRDRDGRRRFTDCEWRLPDGRVVVLEVDGAFHLNVGQYEDDLRRQRRLTTPSRIIVRCGAFELRDDPWSIAEDLGALGVRRLSA